MTRKEEIQAKTEELYGKVNKLFPISEFVNEEKRNCFKSGAEWADKTMIDKVCEWIKEHLYDEEYLFRDNEGTWVDSDLLISDLKKLWRNRP